MSLGLWEFFWNTSDWSGTAVAATSVTFSGPIAGPVNQPSGPFTVGANGAISGTLVVTITNTLGLGTFSKSVFSLSAGAISGTFTYTPTTLGAHLLSDTNNQSLTNAPSLPYLAIPFVKTGSHKLPSQYEALPDDYWLDRERHLLADFKARNDKFTHLSVLEPNAEVHAAIAELQSERALMSGALAQATDVTNLRDIALRIKEIDSEVAALEPNAFVLVKKNIT